MREYKVLSSIWVSVAIDRSEKYISSLEFAESSFQKRSTIENFSSSNWYLSRAQVETRLRAFSLENSSGERRIWLK